MTCELLQEIAVREAEQLQAGTRLDQRNQKSRVRGRRQTDDLTGNLNCLEESAIRPGPYFYRLIPAPGGQSASVVEERQPLYRVGMRPGLASATGRLYFCRGSDSRTGGGCSRLKKPAAIQSPPGRRFSYRIDFRLDVTSEFLFVVVHSAPRSAASARYSAVL